MLEVFFNALEYDGLIWLLLAVAVAGVIRGFSGFGSAMIYMPVAASFLSPIWALTTMLSFDLVGPVPLIPKTMRDGHPRDILLLGLGAFLGVPVGVSLLGYLSPEYYRYLVSIISLSLLVLLILGWRYKGPITSTILVFIGLLGGFLSGCAGIAGPPVILLYMASSLPIAAVRANIILYLLFIDMMMLVLFSVFGYFELMPVVIGLILAPVYMAGNIIGGKMFNPTKEKIYRKIAYFVIGISALFGLPIWSDLWNLAQ